jgi:hypothetical protein
VNILNKTQAELAWESACCVPLFVGVMSVEEEVVSNLPPPDSSVQ